MNANSMLDFSFAQIVQAVFPTAQLSQHVGDALRCEDVARITAIHNALSDVDAPTGNVLISVNVRYPENWTVVQSHPQWNFPV